MTHFKVLDVNYVPKLACVELKEGPVEVGLYVVVITSLPKGTETHYVLAPDAAQAVGMAECAAGLSSWETPAHVYKTVQSYATRLPLTVQGWGKNKM